MWIVKLGGSLAGDPALPHWLTAIGEHGGKVVIVPGGGPFADRVRAAQIEQGFDDARAHHLALLAMEQYGRQLTEINPHFIPAKTITEIESILSAKHIPVWMPADMVLAADDIPASWDMTSDSLAAWLAAELQASGLLLIKSCDLSDHCDLAMLAKNGVVDPLLPHFARKGKFATHLLSRDDVLRAMDLLSAEDYTLQKLQQLS
jgi:5-(aminomethyl)-3-furanmethanol phosphate kinase